MHNKVWSQQRIHRPLYTREEEEKTISVLQLWSILIQACEQLLILFKALKNKKQNQPSYIHEHVHVIPMITEGRDMQSRNFEGDLWGRFGCVLIQTMEKKIYILSKNYFFFPNSNIRFYMIWQNGAWNGGVFEAP